MNLDSFLGWIVGHSVFLIQILALIILASVSFVLFRSVMAGKDEIENTGPSLNEIEKTLRKVLDTTTLKASESALAPLIRDDDMPPPPVVADRKEVDLLRQEIQSRENSLKELQKMLEESKAAGGNAISATEFQALEVKVKELQAKLGEYEVIEDDIANLSTYKSENRKLKSELESLRKRLNSSVEETGSTSENVKQFSQLVGSKSPSTEDEQAASGVPEEAVDTDSSKTPTTAAAEEGDKDQKLINEFEDFMKGS